MGKINRRHKDSIFCALFSDKKNFLSLYNALHETNLSIEDTDITQIRIPQTLYSTKHNDISMLIDNKIVVLIEHQSTINENMPLRCLEYITRIYEILLKSENRYRERIIEIPTPEFYVFYNGTKPYENNKILKLSSSYKYYTDNPPLELNVIVKNITSSVSPTSELNMMKHCNIIKEYTQFIELVRQFRNSRRGLKKAVDEALKRGILKDFLEDNSKEVINMLCARYSYKTDVRIKAEEMAQDLAKDLAKELAIDMAKKMVKEQVKDLANELAHEMANEIAQNLAKDLAKKLKKEMAKHMLADNIPAEKIAEYTSLEIEEINNLN